MSDLALFLKKNKIKKKNIFYPATASLRDSDSKPLKWELKALTASEVESIRESCIREIPSSGGRSRFTDSSFAAKICAAAVVYPDLYNAELQDSYGVTTPHELLKEMIDCPGEFNALVNTVSEHSGLFVDMEEEVETAKN